MHELAERLPDSIDDLGALLIARDSFNDFDPTRLAANNALLDRLNRFHLAPDTLQRQLLNYAQEYMTPSETMAVCRLVLRGGATSLRERCIRLLQTVQPDEVTLPNPSTDHASWDWSGLTRGIEARRLARQHPSTSILEQHGLPTLGSIQDLRELLDIRNNSTLGYLLLATDHNDGPYTTFTIPKRGGGERLICAPKPGLKYVQRAILTHILARMPVHEAVHGFVEGRSTVTNAQAHQGRAILVKFDLLNFFPSISYYRVMGLFAQLGYYIEDRCFSSSDQSRSIAPTLARLTTYNPSPSQWGKGYTPQGAPTSPAISNLICRRLDARLAGLAQRIGATYTRYADDLTFSMDEPPESGLGRFRWWVDQICYQEGFFVNHSKFRVIRKHQRQQVTGIVVNDTLRIPRKERRRFRAILHNCRTHGLASQARGRQGFEDWLLGYASYIHMVHPSEGTRLLSEVKTLLAEAKQVP
ncbi:MAG: reverse transcriptase family protein [Myxococcota bacterium]